MKKTMSAALIAVVFISMVSCKNPPIFAAIEQEVKLKPASVKSFVHGVICINNTLYASNGKLFKKSFGSIGKWSELSGTPDGRSLSIASDGTNLYAVFENGGSFKVFVYDGSSWRNIPGTIKFIAGTKTVFGSDGSKIYKITPTAADLVTGLTGQLKGAVKDFFLLKTGLHLGTTGAAVAKSPANGLKGICEGPGTSVLLFDDNVLYCYNGTTWTQRVHKVSAPQSITYLPAKKLVLISGKGYGEIKLADTDSANLNKAQPVSIGTPLSSIPQYNYYQYKNSIGKWYLNPIAAFDYGSSGYIIYTGVQDPNAKYSGLWGFYLPKQTEWNRE